MDTVDRQTRSRIMSAVRGKGNKSTEGRLRMELVRAGIRGWRLHCAATPGRPDFVFARRRVCVFVDGCFWHGCPRCYRAPTSNKKYWREKIERNMRRDRSVMRELRKGGWRVVRLWEHDMRDMGKAIDKIRKAIGPIQRK